MRVTTQQKGSTLMTVSSTRAAALSMILATKVIPPTAAEFFAANPFDEVLDDVASSCQTPESVISNLRAVCINLAFLAGERWTEDEVMAEQVKELDMVQRVLAEVEKEGGIDGAGQTDDPLT